MKIEIDDLSQAFQLTTRLKAKGVPVSFKAHQTARGRKASVHEVVCPDDFGSIVKEEMQQLGVFESDDNPVTASKPKQVHTHYR